MQYIAIIVTSVISRLEWKIGFISSSLAAARINASARARSGHTLPLLGWNAGRTTVRRLSVRRRRRWRRSWTLVVAQLQEKESLSLSSLRRK